MFSHVVVRRNIPGYVVDLLLQITQSSWGIVALIVLLLLIAGMFIDRNSNILLIGPIIIPIMTLELGFSEVQTAMIVVSALGVGHLTPPFGGTLLTSALVGRMSVVEITRYAWPFILIKIFLTALIVAVPVLSNGLPSLLGLGGCPFLPPCAAPSARSIAWPGGSTGRPRRSSCSCWPPSSPS